MTDFEQYKQFISENNVLCAVFTLLSFYSVSIFPTILGIAHIGFVIFLVDVVLKRLAAYFLQQNHHNRSALKLIFDMNKQTWVVLSLFALLILYNWEHAQYDLFIFMAAVYFLKSIKYDDSTYKRTYNMLNADGLDYGSGMAYSFFHGYLAILLPDKGDNNKGIKENMTLYECNESVTFIKKKLFILVPRSLHCPPNLEEISGQNGGATIEAVNSLSTEYRNRAGVINRSYKNSVYKIRKGYDRPPVYVVCEGATPLKTLHESLLSVSTHSEFYKTHKADIVKMFYKTLVYLIESDVGCRNVCEVVFYDDVENKDVNVAEILLDRIMKKESKAELNF